ncbi:MAG: putative quinol monooxygenase [Acidimicrobiia bacterium]
MIIICGTFDVDPAQRDEFLKLRSPGLAATREEPGCLDYVMAADPVRDNVVYLLERWEDEAAFGQHMEVITAKRAEAPVDPTAGMIRGMEVLRHDIEKSGPLF